MISDHAWERFGEAHPTYAEHIEKVCRRMQECAAQADRLGDIPDEFWTGVDVPMLNRAHLPLEYGGHPATATLQAGALVAEKLGHADPGLALAMPGPALSRAPIMVLGTATQRQQLFQRFQSAYPRWGAFAISEPGAGSDAGAIATAARETARGWLLNGDKCLIGSGARAEYTIVFASIDPARGRFATRAFVVEKGTSGFEAAPMGGMLGLTASQVARISLRDCLVPKDNLLGAGAELNARADGLAGAQHAWDYMRPLLSAIIVGCCGAMLDRADLLVQAGSDLVRHREATSAYTIAQLRRKHLAARLLVHYAACSYDAGQQTGKAASMAKAYAAQLAMEVANMLMDLAGIDALRSGEPIAKWYRDVKAFDILEGTGDTQRLMIAKLHGAPGRPPLAPATATVLARQERDASAGEA